MITHPNERHVKPFVGSVPDTPSVQIDAKREGKAVIPSNTKFTCQGETKTVSQVVVVRSIEELEKHAAVWEELAGAACEPNIFYEPWMLLPAMKAFGEGHDFEFYLIFAAGRGPEVEHPVLNGIFPMERHKRFRGLPASALTLWKHDYSTLCIPLVRLGAEAETLHTFLDYLATATEAPALLNWTYLPGEGAFCQALTEVFNHRQTLTFVDEVWMRAFLSARPDGSGEAYMRAAMSSKRYREFKRRENRLAETGELRFDCPEPFNAESETDSLAALDGWLDEFLKLEASGWKGEEGSAFECKPTHREFFCSITKEAYKRGQLDMLVMRLNGKPIAAKCDFLGGDGAFAFKIAYDEEYSRFSPGVLLALECINHVHSNPRIHWMDSCAVPDHPMLNQLWSERRVMKNMIIATGQGKGEFIVSALPLLRWVKRKLRRSTTSS